MLWCDASAKVPPRRVDNPLGEAYTEPAVGHAASWLTAPRA